VDPTITRSSRRAETEKRKLFLTLQSNHLTYVTLIHAKLETLLIKTFMSVIAEGFSNPH